MKRFLWPFCIWAILLFIPVVSTGYELPPGRVRDPAGIQLFQKAIYNPALDNYLLLYEDGRALVGQLSPNGSFSGETAISGNIGVTHITAAYNPSDRSFLVVYRDGEPATIYGRYINPNGTPIGNPFVIGEGGGPSVDFSPASGRYVVTWSQLSNGQVRYRVIDGDSTSANPRITQIASVSQGLSDAMAYGAGADKFLVVYARDGAGNKPNVLGKFISANGASVGPEIVIAGGTETQGIPRVAYATSTDRWMVMWEDWASCGGGCPHIRAALVAPTGAVVSRFTVAATTAWDQPGALGYNAGSNTFVAGWRSAYSDTRIEARAGEFSPATGALVKATTLLSNLNVGVQAVANRPGGDPQALFVWRFGLGGDGVHAGILDLKGGGGGPNPPPPPPPPPPDEDTIPPGRIANLIAANVVAGPSINARAIAGTNPGPGPHDIRKTVDNRVRSYWSSPARTAPTDEFITWDFGSPKKLTQISIKARTAGDLFPLNYQIQVSNDNTTFSNAFSVTGASVARGAWVHHKLPEPTARYVKILITRAKQNLAGKYQAQIAEVDFLQADDAVVRLAWTTSGDDANRGRAASYDLRWARNPITAANFNSAAALTAPTPLPAGRRQIVTFSGFPRETKLYFAMKAKDDAGNVSALSNVPAISTPGIAPAAVQGLAAASAGSTSVNLSWQPSGDDGNAGNATSYDIRYARVPITAANFAKFPSVVRPASTPKPAMERYTLSGLKAETRYFFAIKARDELGNTSLINGGTPVSAVTSDGQPPAAVTNLSARGRTTTVHTATAIAASGQSSNTTATTKVTDGNLASYWSSPGVGAPREEFITLDLGSVKSIGRVDLLARPQGFLFPVDLTIQTSTNNTAFNVVARGTDLPNTQGMRHTFEFARVSARYVRISITETRRSAGGLYYAQIAEIQVVDPPAGRLLTLTWTETGDDGNVGTAASFDVRWSRSPITSNTQFANATALTGEPAPQRAGATASFSFEPPEEGVTLYFRMKVMDNSGNSSPLSNQVSAAIAVMPP